METEKRKAPLVLDGFMKEGFRTKVFTVLFYEDCLVFCKTGNLRTSTSNSIQTSLGVYTGDAMLLGAIAKIFDNWRGNKRVQEAADLSVMNPEEIAKANASNLLLYYSEIQRVELLRQKWLSEAKVRIRASKVFQFKLEDQSKKTLDCIEKTFNEFLPEKVMRK